MYLIFIFVFIVLLLAWYIFNTPSIVVINLARNKERLEKFQSRYTWKKRCVVHLAIDGRNLNVDELYDNGTLGKIAMTNIKRVRSGLPLYSLEYINGLGAVGCYTSHLAVFDAYRFRPYVTVFEDDAIVNIPDDVHIRISDLPKDWHAYLLGVPHTRFDFRKTDRPDLVQVTAFGGTHAYVISRSGIDFLKRSNMIPMDYHIDAKLSRLAKNKGFVIYAHTRMKQIAFDSAMPSDIDQGETVIHVEED